MKGLIDRMGWAAAGALAVALLATLAGIVYAGPLDPPGPPGPTMKTLDEVEPRIPISSIPFTIDQPGSYMVTQDLVGAGALDGIIIDSDAVTLDLNGFTLTGPGSRFGVRIVNGERRDVVIRNGTIRGWAEGIGRSFSPDGMLVNSTLHDLVVVNNTNRGIRIGGGNTLRNVVASGNAQEGLLIESSTTGTGAVITESQFQSNGVGISGSMNRIIVRDTVVADNGSHGMNLFGRNNEITNNVVNGNGDVGIRIGGEGLAAGNFVTGNATSGIVSVHGTARIGPQISDVNLTTDNPFANVVFDNPPPP